MTRVRRIFERESVGLFVWWSSSGTIGGGQDDKKGTAGACEVWQVSMALGKRVTLNSRLF
uniref:Uncharacterized protein n=1 Tax=Peronospora matthiolae TaxID=2874970 RepID=A0AAV1T921_9STRA